MANTYTQIHIQAVFVVQNRACIIHPAWKEELYKYISGIVQNNKHKMLAINGMPDHVHLFFGFRPSQSLSDLMQDVKGSSSKWINEKGFVQGKFSWQEGMRIFLQQVCRACGDSVYTKPGKASSKAKLR
ncbi:MAG TPA: IS200/IS605 family transposase [Ohtaekwangia sp.]|nr:IS200/IS605 family transposase [Ohtaekwangia sp.]